MVRTEEGEGEGKREGGRAHAYQPSSKTEFLHEGGHSERSEIGKMEPKSTISRSARGRGHDDLSTSYGTFVVGRAGLAVRRGVDARRVSWRFRLI